MTDTWRVSARNFHDNSLSCGDVEIHRWPMGFSKSLGMRRMASQNPDSYSLAPVAWPWFLPKATCYPVWLLSFTENLPYRHNEVDRGVSNFHFSLSCHLSGDARSTGQRSLFPVEETDKGSCLEEIAVRGRKDSRRRCWCLQHKRAPEKSTGCLSHLPELH